MALIEIAHPEHRDALLAGAVESDLLPRSQTLRNHRAYPIEEVREATLRDGRKVTVRPTRTGDAAALQGLFFHLRTRWRSTSAGSATSRRWHSSPSW